MKVAVAAKEPGLDERRDERFGRAAYFVVVDTGTWAVNSLDNRDNQQALHGAGIAAAERVAEQGVDAVITGHLGPKAYQAERVRRCARRWRHSKRENSPGWVRAKLTAGQHRWT